MTTNLTAKNHRLMLSDGNSIPVIGLGTYSDPKTVRAFITFLPLAWIWTHHSGSLLGFCFLKGSVSVSPASFETCLDFRFSPRISTPCVLPTPPELVKIYLAEMWSALKSEIRWTSKPISGASFAKFNQHKSNKPEHHVYLNLVVGVCCWLWCNSSDS